LRAKQLVSARAGLLAETHDHAGAAPGRLAVAARASGIGSATLLAWKHAQLVRPAWSIGSARPVERPALVACRSRPDAVISPPRSW
jgi:hypothetical protein